MHAVHDRPPTSPTAMMLLEEQCERSLRLRRSLMPIAALRQRVVRGRLGGDASPAIGVLAIGEALRKRANRLAAHVGLPVWFLSSPAAASSGLTPLPSSLAGVSVLLAQPLGTPAADLCAARSLLRARGANVIVLTLAEVDWLDEVCSAPAPCGARDARSPSTSSLASWERWGFDIDGVLVAKVADRASALDKHLQSFLKDAMPPHPNAPALPVGAVLVSGREAGERLATVQWLTRWGLADYPLHLRDERRYGASAAAVARFKVDIAHQLALTHMVESSAASAAAVAALSPVLNVMHWDIESGRGTWITPKEGAVDRATRHQSAEDLPRISAHLNPNPCVSPVRLELRHA